MTVNFLAELDDIISDRLTDRPESSYTAKLAAEGITRLAQKVGEEGVEMALAAVAGDRQSQLDEAADLIFHLMVLLKAKGLSVHDVAEVLEARHRG